MEALLLVNFGGPRNLDEIRSFLTELLTDRDVVRTNLPNFLNRLLFSYVAKKRASKISHDYKLIGGKSPIFEDTESIAKELRKRLQIPVLTFHRYLPETHAASLQAIDACSADTITVLPLFPQFSYATTGSIARFFADNLCCRTLFKLRWIHSYPEHPSFISSWVQRIGDFLEEHKLKNPFLLFSAHGVPRTFVCTDDPYQSECLRSYEAIKKAFPNSGSLLCYQSKFGRGEWIRPYTDDVCKSYDFGANQQIVVVPLTFTSDHIETLFEIEQQYLPPLRDRGLQALRCPALNLEPYWLDALANICQPGGLSTTSMLIRHREVTFCCNS